MCRADLKELFCFREGLRVLGYLIWLNGWLPWIWWLPWIHPIVVCSYATILCMYLHHKLSCYLYM